MWLNYRLLKNSISFCYLILTYGDESWFCFSIINFPNTTFAFPFYHTNVWKTGQLLILIFLLLITLSTLSRKCSPTPYGVTWSQWFNAITVLPTPLRLLYGHCGNHINALLSVRQHWILWENKKAYISPQKTSLYNFAKNKTYHSRMHILWRIHYTWAPFN